jgi:hypothetical protein
MESKQLPQSVEVGDKLQLVPMVLDEVLTGEIIQIPTHRRFAVVRFTMTAPRGCYQFCECFRLRPPRDRICINWCLNATAKEAQKQ